MASTPASNVTTPKRVSKMASSQSLNHLLNFTLPPRQSQPLPSIPRRSRKAGNSHGVWNKERFVNAQYRFVMNPMGDYTVHFADPDIHFQWNDILQVIIPRSSALASAAANQDNEGHTSCPICLSPPTAPRMTKCGHIFCFPCILHYLNTSEIKWARCPICFDSVNGSQLKNVKWFDGTTSSGEPNAHPVTDNLVNTVPQEGSTIRMRLIQRPQITTLALPRSHTWPSDLLPPHQAPFHFIPDVYNFAKFMLATPAMLMSDLTRDLDDLAVERRLLAGMGDDLGVSFIDAAELKVRNQIAKANALDTPLLQEQIEKAHRDYKEIENRFTYHEQRRIEEEKNGVDSSVPQEFLSLKFGTIPSALPPPTSLATTTDKSSHHPTNPRNNRQRRNVNPPPPSTSTYYYYQAASGLPVYLHPLDIRILLSHYSSYAAFPDSITIRVEAFSEGTVNDDLRKRCKYLAHMPEGADVVFLEADLEGVVGKAGLKNFEGPLKMRRAKRRDKGKKDDKARAKAEEREREKREYETAVEWRFTPSAMSTEFVTQADDPVVLMDNTSFPGFDEARESRGTPSMQTPAPQPERTPSGVWGNKSFASALHSAASTQPRNGGSSRTRQQQEEDEWEMDIAWHELEQKSTGVNGGRRKRDNKLVVLGGGGGRRR